MSKEKRVEI